MKTLYKDRITMMQILTEWALSSQKIETTKKIPVFYKGILDVKETIDTIGVLSQALSITGITADKNKIKLQLCETLIAITSPVKSFTTITGNFTLKQKINKPVSILFKMSGHKLLYEARAIYDLIIPLIPELEAGGYAVSEEAMLLLSNHISQFDKMLVAPVSAIKNKKATNANIISLVKQAFDICHNVLDLNSISFQAIDDSYLRQFQIYRRVDYTVFHHNNFEAECKFEDSGSSVYNVAIIVNGTDLKGNTDLYGFCKLQGVSTGIHTVSATYKNKAITSPPLQFSPGKTVKFNFFFNKEFQLPSPILEKELKV